MSTCIVVDNFTVDVPVYFHGIMKSGEVSEQTFEFRALSNINDIPIAFNDRSLNYGDGIFTTIYGEFEKDVGIRIQTSHEHIKRLKRDANKLNIKVDESKLERMLEDTASFLMKRCVASVSINKHNRINAFALKILVSRGQGGRGYAPPDNPQTKFILSIHHCNKQVVAFSVAWDKRISIGLCEFQLSSQGLFAGIKHLNRLEQVFIKQENKAKGLADALVCDQQGFVIEASAANVFLFLNGTWITPPIEGCGVRGIMRDLLIAYFVRNNIQFKEQVITKTDLQIASSIILTNALKAIQIVSEIQVQGTTKKLDSEAVKAIYDGFLDQLHKESSSIKAISA